MPAALRLEMRGGGCAAQREISEACAQARFREGAFGRGRRLACETGTRICAGEGGARYNVVFNGLAWRAGCQEAAESTPREFRVLVYSLLIL